jgi:hypothetical protein
MSLRTVQCLLAVARGLIESSLQIRADQRDPWCQQQKFAHGAQTLNVCTAEFGMEACRRSGSDRLANPRSAAAEFAPDRPIRRESRPVPRSLCDELVSAAQRLREKSLNFRTATN